MYLVNRHFGNIIDYGHSETEAYCFEKKQVRDKRDLKKPDSDEGRVAFKQYKTLDGAKAASKAIKQARKS